MAHRIGWFDMPVIMLDRARSFYHNVLEIEFESLGPEVPVAVMQHTENEVGGCLFHHEDYQPSGQGALLYFSVEGRMAEAVSMVEAYGGSIIEEAHSIGPYGYRAVVLDSEGNRIALHCETM